MTFGQQNTEKEAHDMLSYAFENGINIIDTAEAVSIFLFLNFTVVPLHLFVVYGNAIRVSF